MKICVICSGFSYIYGGVETVVFKLSEHWTKQGHEVYILSGQGKKAGPKGVKLIKLPFIPSKYFQIIPMIRKVFPPDELEALSLLPSVLLCLLIINPDIVLSNKLSEALPAHILKIPSVMISQAPIRLRLNAFKKADKIIVNDPVSLKILRKMGYKNVKFILNGVETPEFLDDTEALRTKYGIDKDNLVILTVARLHPQKRIHLIINAFKMIKQKSTLIIVGDGPEYFKLRSLVPKCLEKNVLFLGGLPHEEVQKLYKICDVFTLPDIPVCGGWFGLVQIEAIRFGKMVVTTPSKMRRKWLRNFSIFPDVENPEEYAQALVAAASQKIDVKSNEFRKFIEKFGWKNIANKYIEIFCEVLKKFNLKEEV